MAVILNIESSGEICGVCIAKNGVPLITKHSPDPHSHAATLSRMIADSLQEADIRYADLAAVAVNTGPGSYTGLRIGMATAKGICYGADIPLIGVSTFECYATTAIKKLQNNTANYLILIDARREDAWFGYFDGKKNKLSDGFLTLSKESLQKYYAQNQLFILGNANNKVKKEWIEEFGTLVEFSLYDLESLAEMSFYKFSKDEFLETAYAEPNYLKNFGEK